MTNQNQELRNHLMSNLWKPIAIHTIFQLSWLGIQIKYEFSVWLFFIVMIIAFGLLILWPMYEKKKFNAKT